MTLPIASKRRSRVAPEASRVTRVGVIEEQIEARYSQNRLAAFGIIPAAIRGVLQSRNTTVPAGTVNAEGRELALEQTGEFRTLADIDKVVFTQTANGTPVYLRDIGSVHRGYQHPARLLSYYTWRDEGGRWLRGRAITLSTEMKKGEQIDRFGTAVRARVEEIRRSLPADLVIGTTSDQQRQVREKLDLFNRSLWEAVVLVVLVSLVGFWEWRSALLMALSIPITLAMTFGLMQLVGLDIQQMSIASLIIALGLLVDDPVVAGDAIKRELAQRSTSIDCGVARTREALESHLVRHDYQHRRVLAVPSAERRCRQVYLQPADDDCLFPRGVPRDVDVVPSAPGVLHLEAGEGAWRRSTTRQPVRQGLPNARSPSPSTIVGRFLRPRPWAWRRARSSSPTFTANSFLETTSTSPTWTFVCPRTRRSLRPSVSRAKPIRSSARSPASTIGRMAAEASLASITSFIGAGGPRFWFSVRPEPPAPNYAQLLLQFSRSEDTNRLVGPLQEALSSRVAGARIDVRTVETGPPTIIPVSMRILGDDARVLREEAEKLQAILKTSPFAINVRDDWGNDAIRTGSRSIRTAPASPVCRVATSPCRCTRGWQVHRLGTCGRGARTSRSFS